MITTPFANLMNLVAFKLQRANVLCDLRNSHEGGYPWKNKMV
jgi:hypothetical protein